jgi:hypothetical protein
MSDYKAVRASLSPFYQINSTFFELCSKRRRINLIKRGSIREFTFYSAKVAENAYFGRYFQRVQNRATPLRGLARA